MSIQVPKGMKVTFSGKNIGRVSEYIYILAEDVTIALRSQFSPLVDGGAPKFFKMVAGVTQELFGVSFSGEYKQLGFSIWDSTDPISVSFSVCLAMKTDAKADVIDPMRELIKLPLPNDPADRQLTGLVPPGPSILTLLGKENAASKYAQRLNVQLGGVVLLDCILTSAEPTLCRFSDTGSYPIYAKIQCALQSSMIATKQSIDHMFTDSIEEKTK